MGYTACADTQELRSLLQQDGIGLIQAREVRHWARPCSFADRQEVLHELSHLLQAHVRLAQALAIISALVKKEYVRQVLLCCARAVNQGKSFADTAALFPELFDTLTLHALKAGHDSGFLARACTQRAEQLRQIEAIRAKTRAALAMPLITALFFFLMVIFLILFIFPQFKKIFQTLHVALPASTQFMLAVGDALPPAQIALCACAALAVGLLGWRLAKTTAGKRFTDRALLYLPGVRSLYGDLARAQFLQSLALLLQSGCTLAQALLQVQQSFNNTVIQQQIARMHQAVQRGVAFANALKMCPLFAKPEITSSVAIAHETAQLEMVLEQLSIIFRARALKKLDNLTIMLQPALLILLGVAIGGVLLTLYLPLLQIPQAF